MAVFSRRSFVKSLAQFSMIPVVGSVVSSFTGCSTNNAITLNVVLHGLFVVDFLQDRIQLLTPDVPEHYHGAGTWDRDKIARLDPNQTYTLSGVQKLTDPPPLSTNYNVILSKAQYGFVVNPNSSYNIIVLPFPKQVSFLRVLNHGPNILPTPQNPQVTIFTFSLCPVFTYDVPARGELVLEGTSWVPRIDEKTRTSNLHIWAEPRTRVSPKHAQAAFHQLHDLISILDIRLGTTQTPPLDRCVAVNGMSTEEEQGLAEWISGGEGSHPTNCNPVFTP